MGRVMVWFRHVGQRNLSAPLPGRNIGDSDIPNAAGPQERAQIDGRARPGPRP